MRSCVSHYIIKYKNFWLTFLYKDGFFSQTTRFPDINSSINPWNSWGSRENVSNGQIGLWLPFHSVIKGGPPSRSFRSRSLFFQPFHPCSVPFSFVLFPIVPSTFRSVLVRSFSNRSIHVPFRSRSFFFQSFHSIPLFVFLVSRKVPSQVLINYLCNFLK